MSAILDTIIVGGGPAGLSAALVLGRCLRRVVVCDAGHPRNEPARVFNGYLSRDGSSPAEFLAISREQLRRYETVQLRKAVVTEVLRGEDHFTAVLESGDRLRARMLLIATGLVDELPKIENLRLFYGKTVHNCPYCDGWEVRGQPIAVIGENQDAADLAIELLLWSPDIALCTNAVARSYDEKAAKTLQRVGVKVITKKNHPPRRQRRRVGRDSLRRRYGPIPQGSLLFAAAISALATRGKTGMRLLP